MTPQQTLNDIPVSTGTSLEAENSVPLSALDVLKDKIYIHRLPSYANKIFYGLGFMALTSFMALVISGIVMVFVGPTWWLTSHVGVYFRSVHDWAVQAFIAVLLLHMTVVFLTSGFKPPKRIVWVLGASIFCLALITTEFGYGLRGDFQSQWRAVSGADFWNGAYVGHWFNPESFTQVFGVHVLIMPALIFGLFLCHYLLVKAYGIAKPYRDDIKYKMVAADHKIMFIRGGALFAAILLLAFIFPSPFITPFKIANVAKSDPNLAALTLVQELDNTSGTATYLDSIDPYTYSTRDAYVSTPYRAYISSTGGTDLLSVFSELPPDIQQSNIDDAKKYYGDNNSITPDELATNQLIPIIGQLVAMQKSGLYQGVIDQEDSSSNPTRSLRFLSDTGVLDAEANKVHMATAEWGMAKEETGEGLTRVPPGSWWFAPIGMLNSTVLANDNNGDRDAAISLGLFMFIFILFPYIPYLNRIPEKLRLAPFIWGKP